MEDKMFYNEILIDHNQHPLHKESLEGANLTLEGVNPSCGDDIVLQLKVENDIIKEGAFQGEGCAVSQASADIMLELVIGKKKEEALRLASHKLPVKCKFLRKGEQLTGVKEEEVEA